MELWAGLAQGAFLAAAAACAGLCLAAQGQGSGSRRAAFAAGALALGALASLYLLRAEAMLDEGLAAVFTRDGLDILATRAGQGAAAAAALLALAMGMLVLKPGAAAVLAFAAALAPLAAAHAFAAAPLDTTSALVFSAHAALAVAWFGGLVALTVGRRRPGLPHALARFSRFALPAMIGLLASGVWMAWREGGGAALVATPFGWTLGVKLAALAGVLFCAARLRAALGRRASVSDATLAAEAALALGVMLAAGALGQMEPGGRAGLDAPASTRFAGASGSDNVGRTAPGGAP